MIATNALGEGHGTAAALTALDAWITNVRRSNTEATLPGSTFSLLVSDAHRLWRAGCPAAAIIDRLREEYGIWG